MATITEFRVGKDLRGNWGAESCVNIGMPGKVLVVLTIKRSSGCTVSTAQVKSVEGNMHVYKPFSDFGAQVACSQVRCTEKLVRTQHAEALASVQGPGYITAVQAHYTKALQIERSNSL